MPLNIPLPITGVDTLGELSGILQKLMENRQKQREFEIVEPLRKAQAQEALANSSKSQMLAKLMGSAFGDQQESSENLNQSIANNTSSTTNNNSVNPFSPNAATASSQQRAKQILQSLGYLKETPEEQKKREIQTSWAKEMGASDVKVLDKWNEQISNNANVEPVLEHNMQIMANPKFQEMYKNPEYFGYDLSYLKRFGDEEQVDMLTTLGANTKTLYSSMGSEFKGAFRDFEKKIFDKAIPDEIKDTLPQMVAKNRALYSLRKLGSQRFTLAQNIVRSSNGEISPANALEISKKQINGDDVRKQIEDEFKSLNEKLKENKKNNNKYTNINNQKVDNEKTQQLENLNDYELIDKGLMRITDSHGKDHIIDRDKLDEAKKIDPGLKVKKVKYGES